MTISFQTGSSGWANYVTQGTTQEPRNQELIEVIENDPHFIEKIARYNKFSGEYYKVVISAEKKLSNEEMKTIYEEFKKELFAGFKEDEYIASAVLHQDTDYSHIHICIPKQNLLTNQHLQLYMHGIDTKRMDLIADTIALKHNLKTKEEIKPTLSKPKEYSFEKQRAERNQEPFTFTLVSKKDKALAQQQVTELLKSNIESINSIDEVKAFIEKNTDLKVVKADFDRTKKFHYITIQDKAEKKTRVQGDLFSKDFFKQPKQKQLDQLQLNHKTFTDVERATYAKQVRTNLKKEREKRYKKVQHQGRALKLKLRTEQRVLNNTIRKEPKPKLIQKEKNENPRRTINRSPIPKPTNNNYAGARESRKRAREERIAFYSKHNNRATETDTRSVVREYRKLQVKRERERRNRGIIRELFTKISTVTRQFFTKIRKIEVPKIEEKAIITSNGMKQKTAIEIAIEKAKKNIYARDIEVPKIEEKATISTTEEVKETTTPTIEKKAQNKEKTKPPEALQSPKSAEESHSTVESPESDEEFIKNWNEFMGGVDKELKRSSPKLSQ